MQVAPGRVSRGGEIGPWERAAILKWYRCARKEPRERLDAQAHAIAYGLVWFHCVEDSSHYHVGRPRTGTSARTEWVRAYEMWRKDNK